MAKTKIIGLNLANMKRNMLAYATQEQTKLLVEYAKNETRKIGDMIQTYNSANHMDRNGHLLNSLCWGVTYDGEMKASGFYRDPIVRGGSQLHEFFRKIDNPEDVNGRKLAEQFIDSFKGKEGKWNVFFAILAPYWGYWEGGFKIKYGFETDDGGNVKATKTRFLKFQVMTHIFDEVRMALKPAETHLSVYVPKYSYRHPKYKNRRGYYKVGLLR